MVSAPAFSQSKAVCPEGLFPFIVQNGRAFLCSTNPNDNSLNNAITLTIEPDEDSGGETGSTSGGFTLGLSESEVAQLSGATLLLFAMAFGFRVVRKQFWR